MAKNNKRTQEAKHRISKLLDKALSTFEHEVQNGNVKPSVNDYLKLMQIKQEIDKEEEAAREIEVRWVDTETTKPDASE